MNIAQKANMKNAIGGCIKKWKSLDFVSVWYVKAANLMMKNPSIETALVSTNSIAQGEQAIILWKYLFSLGFHISFAHQTFKWDNNGAAVFVVIVGFKKQDVQPKRLFMYKNIKGPSELMNCPVINEYLLPQEPVMLTGRTTQISHLPQMGWGSKITDGQNLLLTPEEKAKLLQQYPQTGEWIHRYYSARDLLNNGERYVLYLSDISADAIRRVPPIFHRIKAVRKMRISSKKRATNEKADTPQLFQEDHVIKGTFLAIPSVSSGDREYVPMAFLKYPSIVSNANFQVQANEALFALLESKMHMAWLNTVGGRLKGDYRYSNSLVYNTFTVPKLSQDKLNTLKISGRKILEIRKKLIVTERNLSNVYDRNLMKPELRKAHRSNDKIVDSLYGLNNPTDEERVTRLIELYRKKTLA